MLGCSLCCVGEVLGRLMSSISLPRNCINLFFEKVYFVSKHFETFLTMEKRTYMFLAGSKYEAY
jgi:hypothetical protein